jgi:hypothetical protein
MNPKLISQYNALDKDEQMIIMALSVVLMPIGQTVFAQLLRNSDCLPAGIINKIAPPLKAKLSKTDLVHFNSEGWRCNEEIAEYLIKQAVKHEIFFHKLANTVLRHNNLYIAYRYQLLDQLRELRIYLYLGEVEKFIYCLNKIADNFPSHLNKIFDRLFFTDFDTEWFAQLHEGIRFIALKYYLYINQEKLADCSLQYQLLEKYFSESTNQEYRYSVIEYRLLRGNFDNVEDWLKDDNSAHALRLLGAARFLQNRNNEAIECFTNGLSLAKKETRKRNLVISGLHGQFYHLALLKSRDPLHLNNLKKHLEMYVKNYSDAFNESNIRLLEGLAVYQAQLAIDKSRYLLSEPGARVNIAYTHLFHVLLLYWLDAVELKLNNDKKFLINLADFCKQAHQNGYKWYAVVSSLLLERLNYSDKQCTQIAALYKGSPFADIIDLLPRVETWERALNALAQLNAVKSSNVETVQKESRLIWLFSLEADGDFELVPREQKLGKNGRWTKGKAVALKRLKEELAEFDYLTEQDKKICMRIETDLEYEYYGYRPREVYYAGEKALLAAVGHPAVYWAERDDYVNPLELKLAEPQLLVKEKGEQLHISLLPQIKNQVSLVLERTANDGVLIYQINKQHQQVAEILGEKGLTVPIKARQQVLDSIASIASTLTVQSDIGGSSSLAETVPADSRLHIHLQPVNDGLQIEFFVQPFNDAGPIYKPGIGGANVLAEVDGKQLQTSRDFKRENNI